MDKKTQKITGELKDLVVGKETVYSVLIFIMASFLFTSYTISYFISIYPSIFTNIGLIVLGFILFVCGGILLKKFKG